MIAQKIVQAVRALRHQDARGHTLSARVKASVGISTYPKDGATADELISSADLAMFWAKQAGSGVAFAQQARHNFVPPV